MNDFVYMDTSIILSTLLETDKYQAAEDAIVFIKQKEG